MTKVFSVYASIGTHTIFRHRIHPIAHTCPPRPILLPSCSWLPKSIQRPWWAAANPLFRVIGGKQLELVRVLVLLVVLVLVLVLMLVLLVPVVLVVARRSLLPSPSLPLYLFCVFRAHALNMVCSGLPVLLLPVPVLVAAVALALALAHFPSLWRHMKLFLGCGSLVELPASLPISFPPSAIAGAGAGAGAGAAAVPRPHLRLPSA